MPDGASNTDFSRYIPRRSTATLLAPYNIVKLRTDEYVQASRELFMPETNRAEVYYQPVRVHRRPLSSGGIVLRARNRYGYERGPCRYNFCAGI